MLLAILDCDLARVEIMQLMVANLDLADPVVLCGAQNNKVDCYCNAEQENTLRDKYASWIKKHPDFREWLCCYHVIFSIFSLIKTLLKGLSH